MSKLAYVLAVAGVAVAGMTAPASAQVFFGGDGFGVGVGFGSPYYGGYYGPGYHGYYGRPYGWGYGPRYYGPGAYAYEEDCRVVKIRARNAKGKIVYRNRTVCS